jgi:hypothetical protein
MSCRRLAAALVAVALSTPAVALASGTWPWPLGTSISLSYGAAYTATDGRRCTHGGVDIAEEPGASVHSCTAGAVSFAGLVPAGDGKRAYAVTVLADDGLKVTYLPLERVSVRAGESVGPREVLGTLAASGDGSSAVPHLHLGLRRGDRQIDPAALLAAGESPAPSPQAPAPPRSPANVPGPGLPVRSPAAPAYDGPRPASVGRPAAAHAPASATARAAAAAAEAARRALSSPRMQPLPRVWAPTEVRLLAVIADAAHARSGYAWLLLRLALAGVAVLCLRPVVRTLSSSVATPVTVSARRVRG